MSILRSYFLLLFGLLLWSTRLHAQASLEAEPVQGELLGVKQGLSQGMVNCIYQDKEGYMWLSTKDGLNRYDGYHMRTYRFDPNEANSLPDNYCNVTLEDEKGNFWVGTNTKGLFLFNKTKEQFYPVPAINNRGENLCVREMAYEKGMLYLRTFNDALLIDVRKVDMKKDVSTAVKTKLMFSYNQAQRNPRYRLSLLPNTCSHMPGNELIVSCSDSIFSCQPTADGTHWTLRSLSSNKLGIDRAAAGWVSFFPIFGQPDNMLICFRDKIIHYNRTTGKIIFEKRLKDDHPYPVQNYFQNSDGNIYRLTRTEVLIYHPQGYTTEIYSTSNTLLPPGSIFRFFKDRQGIHWLGTSGNGIAKMDFSKRRFKSFIVSTHTDALWKLPPSSMPKLGSLWQGKWAVLDNQSVYWGIEFPQKPDGMAHLFSYDTKTAKSNRFPLPSKNLLFGVNVYNDSKDRLWIYFQANPNKNFIAQINKTTGTFYTAYEIPNSFESSEPYISQFYWDKQGVMWLATINGLYAFSEKNKTWMHWKNIKGNQHSISADGVLSICPDPLAPDKYLWIGTEGGGFNRFDKATGYCYHYGAKDGLPNNVVYRIESDCFNNLWMSTNNGLVCFTPYRSPLDNGSKPTGTFQTFTEEDGLPGNEFNRYVSLTMQNGELMFGGVNGFVVFDPVAILQKQATAPLVFTGFAVLNKPISWSTDSSNIVLKDDHMQTLRLQPGQNIFSIGFATLEYRSNAKKMYRYMLQGFEENWTNPSSKNEVTYTNLEPGTYTFKVMGANTDGVWNPRPISMKVEVLPFWYQTILFKILLLSLIAIGFYAFYRYRLQQILKLVKLRNRIARDLHDEIGSTLSSISIYAASAQKVIGGNEKAQGILSKINVGTSEMMEAMSDMVWAVNTGNDRFDNLANRMRAFAVQATEARNMALHFTDNKHMPIIALDMEQRKNIYLICKEAISNAAKHATATLLEVNIAMEQNQLKVQVKDNGKGFPPTAAHQDHSFGGNGIKNMQSRAAEINATIDVVSKLGMGTLIVLRVPLKKNHEK